MVSHYNRRRKDHHRARPPALIHHVTVHARRATNETRDLFLAVVDLPEGEEVALADLQGEVRLDVLERVDAKAVDIPFGDGMLIGPDEG